MRILGIKPGPLEEMRVLLTSDHLSVPEIEIFKAQRVSLLLGGCSGGMNRKGEMFGRQFKLFPLMDGLIGLPSEGSWPVIVH